jgi:aconitase B
MANVATRDELGYPPLPEDEYDSYLAALADMVRAGAKHGDMLANLLSAEMHIGLSKPAGDRAAFLDEVVKLLRG